jgi:hypothetical protein
MTWTEISSVVFDVSTRPLSASLPAASVEILGANVDLASG